MIPVETIPGTGWWWGIKEIGGRGEFKYDVVDIL
jgi:hypothetical protein